MTGCWLRWCAIGLLGVLACQGTQTQDKPAAPASAAEDGRPAVADDTIPETRSRPSLPDDDAAIPPEVSEDAGDYYYVRGCQALIEKDYQVALREYGKALDAWPEHLGARHDMALAWYGLGRYDRSRAILEALIADLSSPPREPELRKRADYNLALALGRLELWEAAVRRLEELLELDPTLREPRQLLERWRPKVRQAPAPAEAGRS